jgi:prophage antirepressor-like protein
MKRSLYTDPALFDFNGHRVRTDRDEQGNPWFIAVDICNALGIKNSRQSLSRLDDDEKGVTNADTLGGRQGLTTVNESGLYALILRSRKAKAKTFRKWITGTVLPALRKDGMYIAGEETALHPEMSVEQIEAQLKALNAYGDQLTKDKLERLRAERLAELADDKLARRNAFRIMRGKRPSV